MVNEPVNASSPAGDAARRGTFLALPMTLFVAVMLDTFPETRWLANVVGVSSPQANSESPR